MRPLDIERSCEAFGGSTRDPQSPVEAVEKCGDASDPTPVLD